MLQNSAIICFTPHHRLFEYASVLLNLPRAWQHLLSLLAGCLFQKRMEAVLPMPPWGRLSLGWDFVASDWTSQ